MEPSSSPSSWRLGTSLDLSNYTAASRSFTSDNDSSINGGLKHEGKTIRSSAKTVCQSHNRSASLPAVYHHTDRDYDSLNLPPISTLDSQPSFIPPQQDRDQDLPRTPIDQPNDDVKAKMNIDRFGGKQSEPIFPYRGNAPQAVDGTYNNTQHASTKVHSMASAPFVSTEGSRPVLDINSYPPFISLAEKLINFPFGVVKLKNIPYAVTTQEIKHFFSRLSPGCSEPMIPIHTHGYPIHIIIERPTGKTLDCFVEFLRQEDAVACVDRAEAAHLRGKHPKIGQRHVQLRLSSQAELMSAVFPRAKNVLWNDWTGAPCILPNDDPYSEGYRGFFTIEEMASIVKQAQMPQRSPFSSRCMQRAYENMISTVYKFPWNAGDHYTVAARDYLYTSYIAQLDVLVSKVAPPESPLIMFNASAGANHSEREVGLSHSLLMDFLFAGLNCPGFSMRHKFQITTRCGKIGLGFPLTPHAFVWPFQCLSPPFGVSDHIVDFWLGRLADGYEFMNCNGFAHGYESDIEVTRDYRGIISFDFVEKPRSLSFNEAVRVEMAVMEYLVEKGRMKWCLDHNLVYYPYGAVASRDIASVDRELAKTLCRSHLDTMPQTGEPDTSLTIRSQTPDESFNHVFLSKEDQIHDDSMGHEDKSTYTTVNRAAPDTPTPHHRDNYMAATRGFAIDPTTPAFVPTRDLIGINRTIALDSQTSMDATGFDNKFMFQDPFTGNQIPPTQPTGIPCPPRYGGTSETTDRPSSESWVRPFTPATTGGRLNENNTRWTDDVHGRSRTYQHPNSNFSAKFVKADFGPSPRNTMSRGPKSGTSGNRMNFDRFGANSSTDAKGSTVVAATASSTPVVSNLQQHRQNMNISPTKTNQNGDVFFPPQTPHAAGRNTVGIPALPVGNNEGVGVCVGRHIVNTNNKLRGNSNSDMSTPCPSRRRTVSVDHTIKEEEHDHEYNDHHHCASTNENDAENERNVAYAHHAESDCGGVKLS